MGFNNIINILYRSGWVGVMWGVRKKMGVRQRMVGMAGIVGVKFELRVGVIVEAFQFVFGLR